MLDMAIDGNVVEPAEGDGNQNSAGDAGAPPAATEPASPPTPDNTLLSRIQGLDAKVSKLSETNKAAEARAAEAERKLAEYLNGKAVENEEFRAQIEARDAELARVRKEATLATISQKYPETFGVLGEAAAALTEDQLAASEARMAGVVETPVPVGANPARPAPSTPKKIEDMNLEELREHFKTYGNETVASWFGVE